MTKSSTKKLFIPYKEPKREFRSSRRLFKTLSLDESRSPMFDLLSNLEEYFEEEVPKTMAETMEQYMSKTRADYGSGVARPKIEDKDHFELKGQILKELRDNTLSKMHEIILFYNGLEVPTRQILDSKGVIPSKTDVDANVAIQEMIEYSQKWHNGTSRTRSTKTSDGLAAMQAQLNNLGREIKKVNEKVYVAQVGCEQCKGPHYTKDCPLKEEGKPSKKLTTLNLVHLFKEGDIEQQLRDSIKGTMQILRIKNEASTDAAIRNQGASIKTFEIQIEQISKVLEERGFGSLPSSTEVNPRDQVKSISTTVEVDSYPIRRMGSSQYIPKKEKDPRSFTLPCFINNVCFDNALVDLGAIVSVMPLSTYLNLGLGELAHTKLTVELADRTVKYPKGITKNMLVGIGIFVFPVDFVILDMPEEIKVPLILERPFLSTTHAKIDVFKRKITLRVGEGRVIFKSVKPTSSLIKWVYMLSLRERMELDLEVRLMGETLVLNRSLDPLNGDCIELNDLNKPLELRRDKADDLMATIEEDKVVEEFRARNDARMVSKNFRYPSDCDHDNKIRINYAHNLKFSCMIGFEFTHVKFFPLLYVNVMSKKFHNSIMKDKLVYKGNNVVGALMIVLIFVGTFSVVTDFAVLEDMDAYHDEGMGDVIVGEPFLKDVGIKARQFDGMITIHNSNDEVTYQILRSHLRFKRQTNVKCNEIPPLLKVSEKYMMNEIPLTYQKLKGFYKGVLNLGPDYIRDAKTEEWLTHRHVSVYEME
ncbi:putative reverse transcriptase domain-containing protein [Tanacetum coccineum]